MRKACTSLSPSYQPAITFVTVQKRLVYINFFVILLLGSPFCSTQ